MLISIGLIILIFFIVYFSSNENRERIIVIDAGHGGDANKFYYYNGDLFSGATEDVTRLSKEINLSDNKVYYIERKLIGTDDENNRMHWLHIGDSGALSEFRGTKYSEKDIILNISNFLSDLLRQSFKVIQTREDDRYIFLDRRRSISNENEADLFISVHLNSAEADCNNLDHTEVYYNNPAVQGLSKSILNGLTSEFDFGEGFVKKKNDFVVLNNNRDSLLIEVNFICNDKMARFLGNISNQQRVAKIISTEIMKAI